VAVEEGGKDAADLVDVHRGKNVVATSMGERAARRKSLQPPKQKFEGMRGARGI
jgi:hypothetical protein